MFICMIEKRCSGDSQREKGYRPPLWPPKWNSAVAEKMTARKAAIEPFQDLRQSIHRRKCHRPRPLNSLDPISSPSSPTRKHRSDFGLSCVSNCTLIPTLSRAIFVAVVSGYQVKARDLWVVMPPTGACKDAQLAPPKRWVFLEGSLSRKINCVNRLRCTLAFHC